VSLVEKIADAIPDSVIRYVHDHPGVMPVVSSIGVILAMAWLYQAVDLDVRAMAWRRERLAELQIARSEALGG
jgi:hypothetical protein